MLKDAAEGAEEGSQGLTGVVALSYADTVRLNTRRSQKTEQAESALENLVLI